MDDSEIRQNGLPGVGRAGVVALLLLAVLGRAVFLALPVNSDSAMFVYAGKLVAEGGRPGIDLLDNKLPTVGLLMSVPWRCFGPAWPAYAAVGLLLSFLATWFLYRVARDLWGSSSGVIVLIGSAVWLNFTPGVFGALQLETIQAFFASIAGATALRLIRRDDWRDAFLVGLCGGVACWAKPTGGAAVGAAMVAVLIFAPGERLRRLRACGWIALGCGLPVVLAMWTIVVTGMADALPDTVRQLRDYAAGSSFDAMDALKPVAVLGLLGFPLFVLGVIGRRTRRESNVTRADVAFVLIWLAAELAGVVAQRRMYAYHFLPLAPPAAMAAGLLARGVRARSLWMAFGPFAATAAALAVASFVDRAADSRDERVIAFIAKHAGRSEAVWTDDYPRLLVETNRPAGSSVPLIFLMANGDTAPEFFGTRLLEDFEQRRPGYVVFAADPDRLARLYRHHMADVAASPTRADAIARQLSVLQDYLAGHYHAVADIDGMRIWRRNDAPAADSIAAGG